jgi:hypothetical protein
MSDFNDERRYATYKTFSIGDEANNYTLHIESYRGTAGAEFISTFLQMYSNANVM